MMVFSDCNSELGLMDLPLVGETLCGLIAGTLSLGQKLIGFLILQSGKLSFLIFFRKGCIDCAQTTSPFFLVELKFR